MEFFELGVAKAPERHHLGEALAEHAYPHSSGAIVSYLWLNKELGHEASDAG
jgi:hypothetical protein